MSKLTEANFGATMERMREAAGDGLEAAVMVEALTAALERLVSVGGVATTETIREVSKALDDIVEKTGSDHRESA